MPICIECRYPVKTLYTTYSSAGEDTKASSGGAGASVRLTQCPRCKRFADKYVEHDFIILFIDLVLIKPQVYRHLLFNRLGSENDEFDYSILRLGILLLLFDVYLTWVRIEKAAPTFQSSAFGSLAQQPIFIQYLFFLLLISFQTVTFHLVIRFLTKHVMRYNRPNSVSTALLVSSCTKLFPILMVIWDYDVPAAAKSVGWAVVVNNVEALKILLDCSTGQAALLAGTGAAARWGIRGLILGAVGLEADVGGWKDVVSLFNTFRGLIDGLGGVLKT